MIAELRRDPGCFGERILFIHTGGIFGLFPKAREIAPLLTRIIRWAPEPG